MYPCRPKCWLDPWRQAKGSKQAGKRTSLVAVAVMEHKQLTNL